MTDLSSPCQVGEPESKACLVGLPQELYIYLLDFLDWQSITNLRLSCSNFSTFWPRSDLGKLYRECSKFLYKQELATLRQLEQEYWEQAEQAFLGYHSSSYTSSSLDPDLRARYERYSTSYSKLPCYRCLQWLPSRTDPDGFRAISAFSRGMCTGSHNLGSKKALDRICIPCGLRTNLYRRGTRVKSFLICYRCQALFNQREDVNFRGYHPEMMWKLSYYYCGKCVELPEIRSITSQQFWHEVRWKKYEESMSTLLLYRLEQGVHRRKERGMIDEEGNSDEPGSVKVRKPRWCPIMEEMRLCGCQTLNAQQFKKNRYHYYLGMMRTWPVR